MFEALFKNAAVLKNVFDAIKDVVNVATFDCSYTGIELEGLNISQVAFVELKLSIDGFTKYHCDRNLALSMKSESLAKILKYANNEDTLLMTVKDNDGVVTFEMESPKLDVVSVYTLQLLNLDRVGYSVPATDYTCTVRMPSKVFERICRDLSRFHEVMTISFTKESVEFSCAGDFDTNPMLKIRNSTPTDKDELAIIIEVREELKMEFACKELILFTKATPLSAEVMLSVSQDVPLMIEYSIETHGYVKYYLAPKLPNDN